jgi:hypothetical protein
VAGWFARWRSPGGGAGRLSRRLRDYPPYVAPHPGPGDGLTAEQAQENLAYLLGQREHRLQALHRLLNGYGIDISPALAGADPRPLLNELHAWANTYWPDLSGRRRRTLSSWLSSSRQGDEIAYSMLMDIAILMGELIRQRRPGFQWVVDSDEANGRDGMVSYRRPVLKMPQSAAMPVPSFLDLEDIVVGRFLQPDDPTQRLLNGWARLFDEAVSGAHEMPWQSSADPHHASR